MKLRFDKKISVIGLGVFPWTRLGPERWLDQYMIASIYDWDIAGVAGAPRLLGVGKKGVLRPTTQALVNQPAMQQQLATLQGYDFLPYKPVAVPALLQNKRFLSSNQELSKRIENKATFRQLFDGDIRFPDFRIVERGIISRDAKGLESILQGRPAVILQDERLSGGKGTFAVHDLDSLNKALDTLDQLQSGRRLVISSLVENAHERSVQCCVTKYGVFVGPLQKQIVGHPLLANTELPGSDRFCGGEIGGNDSFTDSYPQIRDFALTIGKRLAEMGYKGIFGVDCLVSSQGEVFVLEVNPRLTGMTPLLTMLYRDERDIPFYLLHILELGGYDYTIEDDAVDPPAQGGMLVQHALQAQPFTVTESFASGIYSSNGLTFNHPALHFDPTGKEELLLQRYTPVKTQMSAGAKLFALFSNRSILDQYDTLRLSVEQAVRNVNEKIKVATKKEP